MTAKFFRQSFAILQNTYLGKNIYKNKVNKKW